jgi:hypothetical protein
VDGEEQSERPPHDQRGIVAARREGQGRSVDGDVSRGGAVLAADDFSLECSFQLLDEAGGGGFVEGAGEGFSKGRHGAERYALARLRAPLGGRATPSAKVAVWPSTP